MTDGEGEAVEVLEPHGRDKKLLAAHSELLIYLWWIVSSAAPTSEQLDLLKVDAFNMQHRCCLH